MRWLTNACCIELARERTSLSLSAAMVFSREHHIEAGAAARTARYFCGLAAARRALRLPSRKSRKLRGGVPVRRSTRSLTLSKPPLRAVASTDVRCLAICTGRPAATMLASRCSSLTCSSAVETSKTSFTMNTMSLAESASAPPISTRPSALSVVSAVAATRATSRRSI